MLKTLDNTKLTGNYQMIDFKNGTCRTCKFVYWDGDMEKDGETESAECYRFPPLFIGESGVVNSIDGWSRPRVDPDITVCGEYIYQGGEQ